MLFPDGCRDRDGAPVLGASLKKPATAGYESPSAGNPLAVPEFGIR